ncbi:PQQ-binding-like beta-propeller repeat protein [Candidatus Dojkabacteria bacterium]|jgi:outer membrane protein assembly factor BamB|nr:PQQ-binding-like beta-propeller repeat protein [Candidatus Dojkabacteria bacterium]
MIKAFFKRFWWIFVILGTVTITLIIFLLINTKENHKGIGLFESDKNKFNERIVKTFLPESGTAFKYASPMLYNEHIYIGTSERIGYDNAPISKMNDNFFYKFDLNLNVIWKYSLYKKMVTGGAVMDSNHNLYFVVEALNDKDNANKKERIYTTVYLMSLTEDGNFRWEKQISQTDEFWDHAYITPAISIDNIVYVGQDRFYAFNTNGDILAKYPSENNLKISNYGGAPIIDNHGNVYFVSPEPIENKSSSLQKDEFGTETIRAFKFSPILKNLVWSTIMGNELLDNEGGNSNGGGGQKTRSVESPPAFGMGGNSLYGAVGCTISKVDTATGELLWSIKPDGATGHFNASPAIDAEDNLYIGTKSNNESRFYAISSAGKQLWRTDIGSDLYNSPILTDQDTIYVGSETNPKGKFHILNRKTGEELMAIFNDNERKVPDFSHDAMLLYKGYVYVGVHSSDKDDTGGNPNPTLYKIKVDAQEYLHGAAWPRIYSGNMNNGRVDN